MDRSITVCTPPIVAAVKKADDIFATLGERHVWQATNDTQQRFLDNFFHQDSAVVSQLPQIQSIASFDVDKINRFLAERGFDIRLNPFSNPQDFGCAAVLDLLVEWFTKGTQIDITHHRTGDHFDGVNLKSGTVEFLRSQDHHHPIARVRTRGDDTVYMTILDDPPGGFDLVALAQHLEQTAQPVREFSALHFPMVDLNQEEDITWLVEMRTRNLDAVNTDSDFYKISQALQQTKLRMNTEGARVESAVAISVARSATSIQPVLPPMIINQPFLIWFSRENLVNPLFVGYIVEKDWKNPGSLEDRKNQKAIPAVQQSNDDEPDLVDPWQLEEQLEKARLQRTVQRFRQSLNQ